MRLEIGLGLLVLLATGLLTGASPAKEALQAQHRLGYVGSYQEGGVWCDLWVAPVRAGDNEMAVDVSGWPKGGQRAAGAQVLLRLAINDPNMDMGETQVEAAPQPGNRYAARGSYMSMSGTWQITVILRQTGYDDIVHTFEVQVENAP